MTFIFLLLLELFFLFLLSKALTRSLSRFLSIQALSFLFLPGIVIHELSHLLTAGILFVPVGEIEFMPKLIEGGVKLGSVAIARTDPVRRAIIGFAPVLIGFAIIIGLTYFFVNSSSIVQTIEPNSSWEIGIRVFIVYFIFAVSNTMFSSSKDMEGTVEILIALLIIFVVSYFLGFRPQVSFIERVLTKGVLDIVQKSTIFLLAPISIDLLILGIIRVFIRIRSRRI